MLSRAGIDQPLARMQRIVTTGHVALSRPAGEKQCEHIQAGIREQAEAESARGGCALEVNLDVWEVVGGRAR